MQNLQESTTATNIETFKSDSFVLDKVLINGEPWFVAKTVCDSLGLQNHSQALARLDEDERRVIILNDSTGRKQEQLVVSESGLYSLILGSRKAEAKAFKKWVTSEVLPAIRKSGTYSAKQMSPVEVIAAQGNLLVEHDLRLRSVESENENDTLTSVQITNLDKIINIHLNKYGGWAVGTVRGLIKNTFLPLAGGRTYKEISRADYETACELAKNWRP